MSHPSAFSGDDLNRSEKPDLDQPTPIETFLDRQPLRVPPGTSLLEAIALMQGTSSNAEQSAKRTSYVLVAEDEQLIGILTERDIVKLTAQDMAFAGVTVADVMTSQLITLQERDLEHPFRALSLFRQHRIRHLPVLNQHNQLVGVVTPSSLRQALKSSDLFRLLRVSEVMSTGVVTASTQATALELAHLMARHRVSCVVIQQPGPPPLLNPMPVGIVTERDVVQFQASKLNLSTLTAEAVMSAPLACLNPQDTLWSAHQTMAQMRVRRLVVTDEAGVLAGIITQTSILATLDPLEMQNMITVLQQQVEQLQDERVQWLQDRATDLEDQVAATEQRFRAIFNQTFQFIGLLEPDGTVIEANQTMLDFGGIRREAVINRPFWEARWWTVLPETQTQLRAAIARAAQGEFVRYEVNILGADRIVTLDFSLRPILDQSGQVKLLIPEGRDISDRKWAETALRASQRRYAKLTEAAPVGIFQTDAEGNCLYVNNLWCQIAGIPLDQARGNSWVQSIHPDDLELVAAEWSRTTQAQQPFRSEYRFQTPQGQVTWVFGQVIAEIGPNGALAGYIGTITDINDRKQAEHALQANEAQLKEAQRLAHIGSWEVDLTTDALIWSDETYRIFEVDPGQYEAAQAAFLNTIYPEDRARVDQAYATAIRNQTPYEVTSRLLMADGRIKHVYVLGQTFYDEAHTATRSVGTIQDVTAKTLIEAELNQYQNHLEDLVVSRTAELEESEARFRMMADTAPVLIWISDSAQDHTYVNQVWLDFTGRTLKEELGGGWAVGIHPDDYDLCLGAYTAAFEAHEPFRIEYRLRRFDGEYRWVVDTGRPRFLANGGFAGYIGSCIDITDRREMEQALFREKEQAQITLHSIADAVITTDALGQVEYFNPVAEQLTGWDAEQSHGRPLSEVFNIIHELTRQPIENPVEQVLRDGCVKVLTDHTILISQDGTEYSIEDSAAPIRDRQGQMIGTVMVFHDVTQSRELQHQLSWQASHDALTDLPNRRQFEQELIELLKSPQRHQHHVLCYLDLDQFKVVNDTCGHIAGDELLRQISRLIKGKIRASDTLARLGGDEFGLLLRQCALPNAEVLAEKIRIAIQDFRFIWQGKTFSIGVSIGITTLDADVQPLPELLSAADTACYAAKNRGRNRIHVYQANDADLVQQRGQQQWSVRIKRALETQRFCLYRQTIANPTQPQQAAPVHYEILLRMIDEKGDLVSPGYFIPAAERYNLMTEIDRWVVRAFFDHLKMTNQKQTTEFVSSAETLYFINLSGTSISDAQFLTFLTEQFRQHHISPQSIGFEITETAAISNLGQATRFIHELKQLGCHFALDDFGSGMSSFGYLKNLPVDYLKIDGHFVKEIVADPTTQAIVKSINHIGHVMGLRTIAESVETAELCQVLSDIGVDYVQGYGIDRPSPL
ncbi:MAG: PAS domain S-box protein [Leptolyngbyaceae cyanobacterium]